MFTPFSTFSYEHILRTTLRTTGVLFAVLGLYACAATPTTSADTEETAKLESASADTEKSATASSAESEAKPEEEVAFVPPEPAAAPAEQPVETKAVRIDVSCKNEPYSKYEKQSRASIAKGLSATTAGTFGVGFRDIKEHKKWSETHGKLFTAVNNACTALSQCAKEHPKDKTKQCAQQAEHFSQWQTLAKQFAEKAKQSETTQPPKICSFTPSLEDAGQCFHDLADNVDKACSSEACKETSACWRSVGFLDIAINQAESACRFAHQDLSECRGYQTTTQRRKNKFQQCQDLHKSLNVTVLPVL